MNNLYGRKVLRTECCSEVTDHPSVVCLPTMKEVSGKRIQCLRCGQKQLKVSHQLPRGSYFCSSCIQLGRIDSEQVFYHLPEPKRVRREIEFGWSGTLTAGQEKVSLELVTSVKRKETRLVWAVTGAGKTEMLFQSIYYALSKGYRVGIVSPRVDVCLELFPRIQTAFPKESLALLHGKMELAYQYTHLLVCTTHQLLRFHQAFDVLIIDEVDAFPFVHNPVLYYGVSQALKQQHCCIYLTATPTNEQQEKIKKQQLAVSLLPARYHRRPLPVPKSIWCSHWYEKSLKQQWPKALIHKIRQLLTKNDLLIFCPSLHLMPYLENLFKQWLPTYSMVSVHSKDSKRLEKIREMREKKYRILITSTILERGVTFEGISVLVLGANHRVFSTSALVQIAGRVDRRKEYTAGEVYFIHDGLSRAMKAAIQQIKEMNKQGVEAGIIDEL